MHHLDAGGDVEAPLDRSDKQKLVTPKLVTPMRPRRADDPE
jgi:hypothetical protein